METIFKTKVISSLSKVFLHNEPEEDMCCKKLTGLKNETVSFQVAYTTNCERSGFYRVKVNSPIANSITIRQVVNVPCTYPSHNNRDDNYLQTTPGLFPDLLQDLENNRISTIAGSWQSLWIDIEINKDMIAGTYPIEIQFYNLHEEVKLETALTEITIFNVELPKQKLIHTEWFHGDCLAQIYDTDVFSEKHWSIMENFISTAVKRGCNMILTPHFTPPLDTAKGFSRTTIQLVDVKLENNEFTFSFSNLERWVEMCKKCGMEYFEMSHLFTQWGAEFAPKIMATVDGEYKQLFGWDTKAISKEYTRFLQEYLPELVKKLNQWEINETTYFHISDEPHIEHVESYTSAKNIVKDILKDFTIMDALSHYDFYEKGLVEKPVCSNDHIHSFLDNNVENMWSYYCTSQNIDVSNRFFSMPSLRNRIYGVQLFKFDIEGILHWGYNFYNSMHSIFQIDPYSETCAGGIFPGGDAFLVYPKKDGTPEESIRLMVLNQGINDLRAFNLLSEKIGKDKVMELIEEDLIEPITFSVYPKNDFWLLNIRNKVNELLANS